jgi:hypothetical protein
VRAMEFLMIERGNSNYSSKSHGILDD